MISLCKNCIWSLRVWILVGAGALSGCMGGGGTEEGRNVPRVMTLGETLRQSVPGEGGTLQATLDVTEGTSYGVAATAAGGSFSSLAVELRISGVPVGNMPILLRDELFSQTPGLSLMPQRFFTAAVTGRVTFEFTNATRSAADGGVFGLLEGLAGATTNADVELYVVEATEP